MNNQKIYQKCDTCVTNEIRKVDGLKVDGLKVDGLKVAS